RRDSHFVERQILGLKILRSIRSGVVFSVKTDKVDGSVSVVGPDESTSDGVDGDGSRIVKTGHDANSIFSKLVCHENCTVLCIRPINIFRKPVDCHTVWLVNIVRNESSCARRTVERSDVDSNMAVDNISKVHFIFVQICSDSNSMTWNVADAVFSINVGLKQTDSVNLRSVSNQHKNILICKLAGILSISAVQTGASL
ncbi:unnamed protein product, partial [Oikopleura dioica]